MVRHFDDPKAQSFGWAATAAETEAEKANPWRLLAQKSATGEDKAVPAVIDKETAMYSLKLDQGIGEEFKVTYEGSEPIRFRVVGLLDLGILHGSLLIGEDDLVKRFPDVSGYRYFLIESPPGKTDQVAAILEDRLGDQGFDATKALDRLRDLQAIQNTYLSTFQSLGALGLLLGTFGLATVQVRNVVERRSELALMRAAGFRHSRLAKLVMLENIALLVGGLLTGFVAAMIAVLPHMIVGGASVPLREPSLMLGIVLIVGILSSLFPVRTTLRAPLISALRGD
jgi:ABC-type antimicrobial peptide transport system permease subunit